MMFAYVRNRGLRHELIFWHIFLPIFFLIFSFNISYSVLGSDRNRTSLNLNPRSSGPRFGDKCEQNLKSGSVNFGKNQTGPDLSN